MWCMALLSGKRPKRSIATRQLREWAAELAGIPLWLFEDSYHIVGDLAETIALVCEPHYHAGETDDLPLHRHMEELIQLGEKPEEEKKNYVLEMWKRLPKTERLVFNKLITGGFRMGVSRRNLTKALAAYTGQEVNLLAHRLMGNWDPRSTRFEDLVLGEDPMADASRPYPFFLAYPIEKEIESLGELGDYLVEDKWDGIRGQVIVRKGEIFIWSRGEELVTDKYPELGELLKVLPEGTVIDGEIICHDGAAVMPFSVLQSRIGRKRVGKKLLQDAPVKLIAYDLLEWEGSDIRSYPQHKRRSLLESLFEAVQHENLLLSSLYRADAWEELTRIRAAARERNSEGLMLKHRDAPYEVGRKRGAWWKWKLDPYTVDAVLIYAMRGHGRRANLFTDYTFALWKDGELLPFAKAYSGLSDAEFKEVDRYVKQHTLERFGPVRSVKPGLVFELAFEGIARSSRHKSGIALRFPRMVRIRYDKPIEEAATLEEIEQLLP